MAAKRKRVTKAAAGVEVQEGQMDLEQAIAEVRKSKKTPPASPMTPPPAPQVAPVVQNTLDALLPLPKPPPPLPTLNLDTSALVRGAPHFTAVTSNIKGGVVRDLAPCTAIVSEHNRVGKTAVLDSIRLALTGQHPIGPHYADLCGLTATRVAPYARLDIGNDVAAELKFEEGKKTATHNLNFQLSTLTEEQRRALLPLATLGDLLKLGTTKAREELFRRFGRKTLEQELQPPRGLSLEQQRLFIKMANAVQGDNFTKLTGVGTAIRSEKRALSDDIKKYTERSEQLALEASVGIASNEDIAAAEAELAVARNYEKAAQTRAGFEKLTAELNALIDLSEQMPALEDAEVRKSRLAAHPLHSELKDAERLRDAAHNEFHALKGGSTQVYALVQQLRDQLAHGETCMVCAQPPPANAAALKQQIDAYMAQSKQALDAANQKYNEAERACQEVQHSLQAVIDDDDCRYGAAKADKERVQRELNAKVSEYKQAKSLLDSVGVLEAPKHAVIELEAMLNQMRRSAKVAEEQTTVAGYVRQTQNTQNDLKVVEEAFEGLLIRRLKDVRVTAEEAVNAWMPEGFQASLVLEEDGKDVCRWEVLGKDGKAHPQGAASGAEWGTLAVALACAWTEGNPVRVLLLDDGDFAGLNPTNLKRLLSMVAKAVKEGKLTQAICAWARPEEIATDEWTVVSL